MIEKLITALVAVMDQEEVNIKAKDALISAIESIGYYVEETGFGIRWGTKTEKEEQEEWNRLFDQKLRS
ncbi:hypothetical protein [Bacillus cereus]|uniref:hypothetical protein n=1 Tax=Bacillus cereus TaxID=1396 RepID=UPI000BF33136|nr:hypothetical protein [Bacillus cereus]PEU53097.1 hypothetical protein CN414_20650 [Bacillus cereus]PGU88399.1 hypothetical protein COD68_00155 [Bacillus cereus]